MLVYLPQDKHIGISQRIEKEAEREALREKLSRLVPGDEPGGFIVRTMAESASEAELAKDIEYLRKIWRDIQAQSTTAAPPALLYQELSLAQRVLRDFVNPETSAIVIDSRENFARLTTFAGEYTPTVAPLLEHYTGQRPLFDLHGVEDQIQKALARRVDLKSGGYLIIDQTEAMTTIDVNTGGFVGVRNFDDTIFKTNLEATHTITRPRPPAASAQPRRHHHRRLHRHGERRTSLGSPQRVQQGPGARPYAPDGQRLHRPGPGRDDAQADARIARARAV